MRWLIIDTGLILLFAAQHSLLTTQPAVRFIEKLTKPHLWNFIFSMLTIVSMVIIYLLWVPSGITIYRLESPWFEAMVALHIFFIAMFFYCFKYTSFWQWLGVAQLYRILTRKEQPKYYKINKSGFKRYIRFPHHTFLILIFWAQPAMTLDTLLLAIGGTIYTWVGTMHQDTRGRQVLGDDWLEYSKDTHILLPAWSKLINDLWGKLADRPINN